MATRIALFNHKGGVSKTTTTFNLGWMLAAKGHRVIMVDTDPQCNLTGLVMGYRGPYELERFYKTESNRNLKAGLAPAFESVPKAIEPVDCVKVQGIEGLYLLPGNIGLSEYEVTLGIAQELSASIRTLQNLPGSVTYLLEITAEKFDADIVLIDMNPSLSSFNQNLLMTSHFFVVPTNPDYFSVMAIDSLANVFPRWRAWAQQAVSLPTLKNAAYPFPSVTPRFLGTIVQNYRPRKGAPTQSFQAWIDELNRKVSDSLIPIMRSIDMMLPSEAYEAQGLGEGLCLSTIPDFNALIAKSQESQTPVYALTPEQIGQQGIVLERTLQSRDTFKRIFSDLADKIVELTSYECSD